MLQITIFLLCVYLIFKGKELVMLAEIRQDEGRDEAVAKSKKWYLAAYIFAFVFAFLAISQGSAIPSRGF